MSDRISETAELWLRLTEQEFGLKIANIENCLYSNDSARARTFGYASPAEARMAMLRLAYLKGREDALTAPPDFEADVKRIIEKVK